MKVIEVPERDGMVLVIPGRRVTSSEILEEIEDLGLRPATIDEIRNLGESTGNFVLQGFTPDA